LILANIVTVKAYGEVRISLPFSIKLKLMRVA
jgi:hypothetical protein